MPPGTVPETQTTQRGKVRVIAILGALALAVALSASAVLVLKHLGAMNIPGCGQGSGCDELAKSKWGKIPGIGISTAGLGLAYFVGLTPVWVVWGVLQRNVSKGLVLVACFGGAVSLLLLGVMLNHTLCRYCLAIHIANFAFVATALWSFRSANSSLPRPAPHATKKTAATPHAQASSIQQVGAIAGLILAMTAGIIGVESSVQADANRRQEAALNQSVKQMTDGKNPNAAHVDSTQTPPQSTAQTPKVTAAEVPPTSTTPADPIAASDVKHLPSQPPVAVQSALEGRFRWGPDKAAIRIVMFTDYQCPDCKLIEEQLEQVQKMNLSLSVSIRFFPFSTTCNDQISENMHQDACFAAAAAFAVGQLGGTDAFWAMHQWLFERKGSFTPQQLAAQVNAMGFDGNRVVAQVNSPTAFDEIKKDIKLGADLGLRYTPMIFVNGVELKGFTAPNALVRTIQAVAATNPQPAGPEGDRPPLAADRFVSDWREALAVKMPERYSRRWLGPVDAPVSVVVVGDYMEPGTAEVDSVVRGLATAPGGNVKYNFVLFPVNQECNPNVPFTKFAKSCMAARAAEGATLAGGEAGFWRMHKWLMDNRDILSAELIRNGAPAIELDADSLEVAMQQRWVTDEINEDALAALSINVTSLPAVFINGKPAVNWKLRTENLLPRMIEEAAHAK